MSRRFKIQYYSTAMLLAAVLFALFSIFPLTGDDWFRESLGASLGGVGDLVRTVARKWSTTNGRILGNVLAYTAGSRPIVRDIMRTLITFGLIALLARVSGLRKASGLLLCAVAVIALPREMFREIYPWAAGYFNYVPPVALALGALALMPEVFAWQEINAGKARCAALFFLGFASQLFVENITFYVLCAAGILNVLQLVRHKRLSAVLVCYFIGALLGAVLLLASPSYLDMLLHGGSYQVGATNGLRGLIMTARNNCATVFRSLLAGCPVLYCSITALLGVYIVRSKPKTSDVICLAAMLACCACLLLGEWSDIVTALICLAWFALSAAAIVRRTGQVRGKAMYFMLAALCAAFPLLFVNPIGPRCLYVSYVFLLAVALSLLSGLKLSFRHTCPLCLCMFVGTAALLATIYYPLHKTDMQQRELIEDALARGDREVTVPAYEDGSWLWDADSCKMEYAYYYDVPGDLKIIFAARNTGE
ncbi:MAG: DUF6056 family protein [Oscillospiraceae bacterium]